MPDSVHDFLCSPHLRNTKEEMVAESISDSSSSVRSTHGLSSIVRVRVLFAGDWNGSLSTVQVHVLLADE